LQYGKTYAGFMNGNANTNPQTHTIFGAGQVGRLLADVLLGAGHRVRLVRRSAPGPERPGLTWMQGDATDADFADTACSGADVVYNCANPSTYYDWDRILPPLVHGITAAAARAGSVLVTLDNLYMYGMPTEQPFDETTPFNPRSRKGELRARLAEELFEAHRRGDVRVTSGRASDYFGPDCPNAAIFSTRTIERLARGKSAELLGNPHLPRSYAYTMDVARGLATLGTRPEAIGRPWHLPHAHHGSTMELIERYAAHLGVAPKAQTIPRWALRGIGLFSRTIRGVAEMAYQWEHPFVIDDSQFRHTFGVEPTPIDEAVADAVDGTLNQKTTRAA
jgi:nucleoside-diphosphate-sugar epimerase